MRAALDDGPGKCTLPPVSQASGSSDTDGGRGAFCRLIATHPDNGLTITTGAIASAGPDGGYSQTPTYAGGLGGATWSVVNGVLHAGLTLSGDHCFSALLTDQTGDTAARNYALTMQAP